MNSPSPINLPQLRELNMSLAELNRARSLMQPGTPKPAESIKEINAAINAVTKAIHKTVMPVINVTTGS